MDEHSTSNKMPYLFNGKELDYETGLYYYGARYYDPKTSIFLNVDPLVEKTGTPYVYTYNNPIRYIDPTGMEAEECPQCPKPSYDGQSIKAKDGNTYFATLPEKGNNLEWVQERKLNELEITGKQGTLSNANQKSIQDHIQSLIASIMSTDWGEYIEAADIVGIANEVNTQTMEYSVRNNYKSARTWKEFEKLRPTQKDWRIKNTLGKSGAQYLKYAKNLNIGITIASVAHTSWEAWKYYRDGGRDWRVGVKAGADLAMTGIGTLGPIGFGISAGYFIIDKSTSGFGTDELKK